MIARRYGTTWQSLVYWNQDRFARLDPNRPSYDPNRIDVGWTLRLKPDVVIDYDAPLPTSPTPEPTAEPATGSIIEHGNRSLDRVALTFDMGGRIGDGPAIVTWLSNNDVPATIFITGATANTAAGQQVLATVDARADIFDLGNHSYDHPRLTELGNAAIADQLTSAEVAIERHAASNPQPLFRPPFGAVDQRVADVAASVGYPYTMLWDVDPRDWEPTSEGGPTRRELVDIVVGNSTSGSIVLMHLGGYHTLEALPAIVDGMRARGFELVTLETMLGG